MRLIAKHSLAMVLSVLMLLSVMTIGFSSVFATDELNYLYLVPNKNWNIDNARFAAYFFDGSVSGDAWVSAEPTDVDGTYCVSVPDGGWTKVIFCRMNPYSTGNSWDNKWNQTSDLAIPTDGTNCYIVKENTWDSDGGTWSVFDSDEPVETKPYIPEIKLSGGFPDAFWSGVEMSLVDGYYSYTYDLDAGLYEFKIVEEGKWLGNAGIIEDTTTTTAEYGWEMSDSIDDNCTLKATGGTYTFNYNPETNMLIVLWTPVETPTEEETESTVPTEAKEYTLIGYINGMDVGVEADWTNPVTENIFIDGELSITFTETSYVFVKTTDNSNWYKTNKLVTDNSATLATTGFEKMQVPAGTYTFTLVENQDGTLTLSYINNSATPTEPTTAARPKKYTIAGYINGETVGDGNDWANFVDEYTFVDGKVTITFDEYSHIFVKTTDNEYWYRTDTYTEKTSATLSASGSEHIGIPAGTHTFTLIENADGTISISYETKIEKEYMLIGSINGKTVGVGKDHVTVLPEYTFVDGSLKMTFTEDSFVSIKTTDNSEWFTSAGPSNIFYSIGEKSERVKGSIYMYIPAGEATITLVENENGTVNLSYTVEGADVEGTPSDIYISGGFNNWERQPMYLPETGNVVKKMVLPAGKYSFKLVDGGLWYGSGSEIDNVTTDLQLDKTYGDCVLNAVGGEYAFILNTKTHKLSIEYTECEVLTSLGIDPRVTLSGDFNGWSQAPVYMESDEVVVTSMMLKKGIYNFKFVERGLWYGNGSKFRDVTTDLQLDKTYGDCVLYASGGEYTFRYNKVTHKLTVEYRKCEVIEENGTESSIKLSGDFNGWAQDVMYIEESKVVKSTMEIPKGIYDFKIVDDLLWYGSGCEIEDMTTDLQLEYTLSDCQLKSNGGKYTFIYNRNTKKLTIDYVEYEVLVKSDITISGEFNGWGQDAMMVVSDSTVKTTLELPKGTYMFKIVRNGLWYGSGSKFADTATDLTLGYTLSECVLEASGGRYTILYNTEDCTMTVEYEPCDVPVESDVTLSGDFNGWSQDVMYVESNDVVSTTVKLDAGKYMFKIVKGGLWYGSGSSFTDTTADLQTNCTYSECILDATGGTYKISFNTTSKKLTVEQVK